MIYTILVYRHFEKLRTYQEAKIKMFLMLLIFRNSCTSHGGQTCDLLHAIYYYYFEILLFPLLLLSLSNITITLSLPYILLLLLFITISKPVKSYTGIMYFPYTFYNNKHQIIYMYIMRLFINTN